MNDERRKALAVGDAGFNRCRQCSDFIADRLLPALLPIDGAEEADVVIVAQLIRIDYWLRSFYKMDSKTDYQGVSAGCRAILECTIDICLLRGNPGDYQKVLDWEDSAKLKHAEAIARYVEKDPGARRDGHDHVIDWARRNRERIKARRRAHGWMKAGKNGKKKPQHPNRWTDQDLGRDAQAADEVQLQWPAEEGPPLQLERYYETRYRELCWDTHGSGNIRRMGDLDLMPVIGAHAFYDSARLSITAASWVVQHLGRWDDAMSADFDEAANAMNLAYNAALAKHGFDADGNKISEPS